jgi:hypothetical protein
LRRGAGNLIGSAVGYRLPAFGGREGGKLIPRERIFPPRSHFKD